MKVLIDKNKSKEGKKVEVEMEAPFASAIIDPPWPYTYAPGDLEGFTAKEGQTPLSGFIQGGKSAAQYNTLSIREMAELPIGKLVGGYILLWTTMPFLPAALLLLEGWDFGYITGMCWGKYNMERDLTNGGRGDYGGVGFWFLGNHELCLLGKKKGVPSIRTGRSSLFLAKKQSHSQKPERVHVLIEDYFPKPFVEIFGRTPRKDWKIIGDGQGVGFNTDGPKEGGYTKDYLKSDYGLEPTVLSSEWLSKLHSLQGLTRKQKGA